MEDTNNYISKNNIVDALNECIRQNQFNFLRLLCIIYHNQFKDNKTFMKIFNLSKQNNVNGLIDCINSNSLTRVYLTCNWCSSQDICNLWNKMSKGNYTWDNIKVVWELPADYYCVINKPEEGLSLDLSKTILFRMEPNMEKYPQKWTEEWSNPVEENLLFCGSHNLHLNNVEWHLSKTYNELLQEQINKNESLSNILSTVLSDKYTDIGQQRRVDFIKFLETKGLEIDVFGGNKFLWKNYKGSLPSHEKDNALFPYKYTFNCENHSIKNYCTEKLYDGILSECLVFYSGCYNIRDVIDNKAFVYLELSNFEKDYNTIKKAIDEDLWSQRLPYIKEAKNKILNELHFFPRIKNIIEEQI
jgi:hypothetical protein